MKRTQLDQVLELRLLPVTLSRGELADRAAELARVVEERGTLDLLRKVDAARWRFKLGAVAEAVERLAHVVASGAEDRETEVTAWLEGTDRIVLRLDTGDEIERRPATPEELQTRLFEAPAVVEAPAVGKKRRRKVGRPAESSLPFTAEHRAALEESEARDREYHARIAAEDRDAAAMLAGHGPELDPDEFERRCAAPKCDRDVAYPDNYCDEHDPERSAELAARLGVSPPVSQEVRRFEVELARLNAKRDYEERGARLERAELERRQRDAELERAERAVGRPPEGSIP